eukprot:gnl/Spiro4/4436_TR2204_c0_g1_i1.p1 gnl/Spiro4/4436_TR2204_c0_g1~~gnl/Spiro4/4436_TR2204_c0_g1_i1.p1  ORF type:complete len:133 (-),score=10.29 gnl/Spiro4/4436_TR2204_c0_g1_i1:74-436(-)
MACPHPISEQIRTGVNQDGIFCNLCSTVRIPPTALDPVALNALLLAYARNELPATRDPLVPLPTRTPPFDAYSEGLPPRSERGSTGSSYDPSISSTECVASSSVNSSLDSPPTTSGSALE